MNADKLAARIGDLLGSSLSSSAERLPLRPPPPVPDHEIIAHIGGGSYGEVWLARGVTGALRAVKVVWRSHFSSDRPYEREFHGIVNFEPISRSHPAVVNILHVGRDDAAGCFFYVMELADDADQRSGGVMKNWSDGQNFTAQHSSTPAPQHSSSYRPRTLASDLKSRSRLPVGDAVALGVQLAGALGHLHRHGLVHRDVKPSNVIFVHGQAKLADIGLVTGVHEERSFVGTEGFIPPEGPGSERADLFALGRLLYETATGKNRSDFPSLPDDLDRWPKSEREALIELNEVLARACAPEARKRHSNAADLAGDLNLILAGRSVRRAYGIERQLRRATLVSVIALALVLVAVLSNWLQRRQRERSDAHARREAVLREQAEKSLTRAEAAERASQQQLYAALLGQSRATVLTGELGQRVRALDAVRRASAISNSAELRGVAIAALALPDLHFERELPVSADLEMTALDPAFERIALSTTSGPIEVRSISNYHLLATLPASTNRPPHFGKWSPDGRFLAVSWNYQNDRGARIEIWDVTRSKPVFQFEANSFRSFSFHPRLPQILVGERPAAVSIWNLETGLKLTRHELAENPIILKFAPDGNSFATSQASAKTRTIRIYSASDGVEQLIHEFPDRVHEFDWHPSGRWLAVGDNRGGIHLLEQVTGEAQLLGRHQSDVTVLRFNPDGRYLFSGGWDRELRCWDVKSMRQTFAIRLDTHQIEISADGRQCAIMQIEPTLRVAARVQIHRFDRPALHREFAEDVGGPRGFAAFSPDGRWLAASGDERLVVWDLSHEGAGTVGKTPAETRVSFARNGELFVNPRNGGSRWQVSPGTNANAPPQLKRLTFSRPAGLLSFCLLSNGVVFTGTNGSRLGTRNGSLDGPVSWVPTIPGLNGASADERWLAMFRPFSPDLYVHRLPGLERVAKLTNPVRISHFEFSPDGGELAVVSRTGVEFWSTTTWQRTRHLTNFRGILYSPDARTLWLTTDYRTAGLYDARTTEPILSLPPNSRPLALSPDGRQLAVSVDSRRVQVWDLAEVRVRLRELGLDWQ